MKKVLLSVILVFALYISPFFTFAQSNYKTAAGLVIDFGKGTTLAGPTLKNFFNNHNALQVEALLGSNYFSIGAFYQYHLSIKKESGLKFKILLQTQRLYRIFAQPSRQKHKAVSKMLQNNRTKHLAGFVSSKM